MLGLGKEIGRNASTGLVLAMGVGMIGGGWLADLVPHPRPPPEPGAGSRDGNDGQRLALVAGLLSPATR